VSESYIGAARDKEVVVHVQNPPKQAEGRHGYYADCLLKLVAFNIHTVAPDLKRVLVLDSDQLILKNLDSLFEQLPNVDIAATRAYWIAKDFLSATFMMIEPSDRLWKLVSGALSDLEYNQFDMDLVNNVFGDTAMVLSGEYATLNSHWEEWTLPNWYHPASDINMTTVELVNKLSGKGVKREVDPDATVRERKLADDQDMETVQDNPPDVHTAPSPRPRFPLNHPIAKELYLLYETAAVVHFSALSKPWLLSSAGINLQRPDAHPVLAEQVEAWRNTADEVCPGGIPG
jgi:hypothetical protein